MGLGLSAKEIRELKYEEDRVNKIMELQSGVKTKKKKSVSRAEADKLFLGN